MPHELAPCQKSRNEDTISLGPCSDWRQVNLKTGQTGFKEPELGSTLAEVGTIQGATAANGIT